MDEARPICRYIQALAALRDDIFDRGGLGLVETLLAAFGFFSYSRISLGLAVPSLIAFLNEIILVSEPIVTGGRPD